MPRKKKIDPVQEAINTIQERQFNALKYLLIKACQLEDISIALKKKINRDGVSGYYSVNNDSMAVVESLYRTSLMLGELKQVETMLLKSQKDSKKLANTKRTVKSKDKGNNKTND